MQIITSRALHFTDDEIVEDDVDGKKTRVRHIKDEILVRASQFPQLVPNWVGRTELFDLAVEDGFCVQVMGKAVAPKTDLDTDPKPQTMNRIKQAQLVTKPEDAEGDEDEDEDGKGGATGEAKAGTTGQQQPPDNLQNSQTSNPQNPQSSQSSQPPNNTPPNPRDSETGLTRDWPQSHRP